MRVNFEVQCNDCKRKNYSTSKNKKNTADRIEISKFCPFCRKHVMHKEVKK